MLHLRMVTEGEQGKEGKQEDGGFVFVEVKHVLILYYIPVNNVTYISYTQSDTHNFVHTIWICLIDVVLFLSILLREQFLSNINI